MGDTGEQADDHQSAGPDRRIAAILGISEALCGKTEYTEVVASALEASLETVRADSGSILLHSVPDDTLVFEYVVGPAAAQLLGRAIPADEGIAGKVFRTGRSSLLNDVAHAPEHSHRIADETGYPSLTMITVPLRTLGGRTLGAMQAINKRHGVFSQEDLELLTIVGTQAATIIENARLHQAARLGAIARLLAKVGHDIKNLVSPVIAGARALESVLTKHFATLEETCAQHPDVSPDLVKRWRGDQVCCQEATDLLLGAAKRVAERTQQMADCIRGEMRPAAMAPTGAAKVALEVVEVLAPVAQERGVCLELEAGGDCPDVMADASQLFNAIYNLVMNAIPATPGGGRIVVRVGAAANGASPAGRCVRIDVQDTGVGIPPQVLRRLFTPAGVSTKAHGSGLGTRIVKEIADLHGGTVSVESEVGKGSCFTLVLPLE